MRCKSESTKEEEDEMCVLSASNKRVSVELVGEEKIQDKLSRFEELKGASLPFLGVSTPGNPAGISTLVPNLKELDLTGNLLSEWKGSPLPLLLYDEMTTLMDIGIDNDSTILVDEES